MHGTQPDSLTRTLGPFTATNIVVANMIGAGIFTTSGLLMADLFSPWLLLLLWAFAAILALCGALCYAELGATMPKAGAEYAFLSELYHPAVGFLTGWMSFFVGFSAAIAASSLGCAEYLEAAYPGLFAWGDPQLLKRLLAITIIAVFTLVHVRGLEFGARVQNILTAGKVLLIVVFVGAGFMWGNGDLGHLSAGETFAFDFAGMKVIGLSLMWIMFAYSGWNAAAYLGSEIRDPERSLPMSLLAGTGIVAVLYLLLNFLFIYAASPAEMSGVISIHGLTAGNLFGPAMETLISLLVAFALLSSLSAYIILGPRVYYAMARDGSFFKIAARIHPVFHTPWLSILIQGAIASVMVMTGTFDQLLTYLGFSLGIFPLLAVFGVFKLRRSGRSRVRMPLYPLAPVFFLVVSFSILVLAYMERPVESTIAVLTVVAGIPAYFIFTRQRPTSETTTGGDSS
jgi:APA family basic amino acid/polyamine antiporter